MRDKSLLEREVFYAGQSVFREGQEGHKAYLIESGEIELTRHHEGKSILVAAVGPNTLFGEMAILDSAPRMATATAITDVVCIAVRRDRFENKIEGLPRDRRNLFGFLMDYARSTPPWSTRADSARLARETSLDILARRVIGEAEEAETMIKAEDPVLFAVLQMLVGYAHNRLPSDGRVPGERVEV